MTDFPSLPYPCPYCGKISPKHTRVVWIYQDTGQTHQRDESWSRHLYVDALPRNIEDCRRLTNQQVVSVHYNSHLPSKRVSRFGEWDGHSYWHRRHPFCSGPCGMEFAREAFRAGYRVNGRGDA